MSISRRAAIATSIAPLLMGQTRQKISVSSYSFWHFKGDKFPLEKVIDHAQTMGFDGVELLHRQFASEEKGYLNSLKQRAFDKGLSMPMLSIHQDFVSPDAAERQKNIDHTKHCIDLAAQLGIACVRLNSGRWKTIKSFDDLMKAKGDEPPIAGYKEADAIGWCVDSIRATLPHAESAGVKLALENHWGLTTKIPTLLDIWKQVNSPWLGINLDTGNYPDKYYEGIAQLAPHASIVQAKTYYGGGVWYTLDLDYKRIAGILKAAKFGGWVSLEMEGNEDALTAVPKSLKVLRQAFA
jgi:L-ribulose-5-phosphate 3-epimerase